MDDEVERNGNGSEDDEQFEQMIAILKPHARQFIGAPPDRSWIALVVDDHDIADDAHLVAVRIVVIERDGRNRARIARIGNIDDRRAEMILVGNMPHVGMMARHSHLARACEIDVLKSPADWLWSYRRWRLKKPLYGAD